MNKSIKSITFAISTLGKRIDNLDQLLMSLQDQIIIPCDIIIILQSHNFHKIREINYLIDKYKSLNVRLDLLDSLGLSASRNHALEIFKTDLLVMADDDVIYDRSASELILRAFNSFSDATAITFQMLKTENPAEKHKRYKTHPFLHTIYTSFNVSSPEIVYNRRIKGEKFRFDIRFGLGSTWATGEENIFLIDLIRNNHKVYHTPLSIVYHPEISSGFIMDNRLIKSKGAMFYRMFGLPGIVYGLIFALKKILSHQMNISQMGYILVGVIEFMLNRKHKDIPNYDK